MAGQVIITGGNRGIGWTTTVRLLERGFTVHVLSRTAPKQHQDGMYHHPVDLSKTDDLQALTDRLPTPDVLINNAGVMLAAPWDNYPLAQEQLTLAVNLVAPIRLMQLFGERMAEAGHGRIINVGSIAGQLGHPDIWYGATKAALLNATKSFARALGPSGICVNLVAPGPVETEMLSAIPPQRLKMIQERLISGRVITANEVAKTIEWLAIDSPTTLNGTSLCLYDGAA